MKKLTKEIIENAEPRSLVGWGYFIDGHEERIGMPTANINDSGRLLKFVVARGQIADWCVYVGKSDWSHEKIHRWGDKITSRSNVENLIGEVSDKVWDLYRF